MKGFVTPTLALLLLALCSLSCSKKLVITENDYDKSKVKRLFKKSASPSWIERYKAMQELFLYINTDQKKKIERLFTKALEDPFPSIRITAIKGLLQVETKSADLTLLSHSSIEKNPQVLLYLYKAYGVMQNNRALPILIKGYKRPEWYLREQAIEGMLLCAIVLDIEVILPYIHSALRSRHQSIRLTTLNNLWCKDISLYKKLINLLKSEKSGLLELQGVLKALEGYRLSKEIVDILVVKLGSNNRTIRVRSLRVLQAHEKHPRKSDPGYFVQTSKAEFFGEGTTYFETKIRSSSLYSQ